MTHRLAAALKSRITVGKNEFLNLFVLALMEMNLFVLALMEMNLFVLALFDMNRFVESRL